MTVLDLTDASLPDDGETFHHECALPAGETLEVLLREIPSAGYAWAVRAIDGDDLRLEEFELQVPPQVPGDETVGGSCVRRLSVRTRAHRAVPAKLSLVYERSWEPHPLHEVVICVTPLDEHG